MVSAESTEPAVTEYRVPGWMRVREEDFGLLFYDTRSTSLTFVRSGDRLGCRPTQAGPQAPIALVYPTGTGGDEVELVLRKLVAKGLLEPAEPDSGRDAGPSARSGRDGSRA
jgi:putative mycofactocin binding protein MftB